MKNGINAIVAQMRDSQDNVRYEDVLKVCEYYFSKPRQKGTSHCVFKTPWQGDPRVNIQRGNGGKAKKYQVKQVLAAIDRVLALSEEDEDGP